MKKQNNYVKTIQLAKFMLLAMLRNPSAIFFGFLFPFIFIIAFGLIGNSSSSYDVYLTESTDQNSDIVKAIKDITAINIVSQKTAEEYEKDLKAGKISAILNIEQSEDKMSYTFDLQTSSAEPRGAAVVNSIISNVVSEINSETNKALLSDKYNEFAKLNVTNIEGRKYTQIDFILPGQLSFALLTTGVFNIAFSIITLRKTLVLKRMFATPTPKWVIMFAKVLSGLFMGVLQAIIIIGVGHFAFGFTLVNGFSTFISMTLLSVFGLVIFLGLGLFVSALGDNEDSVSPIANLITMPQLILSGAFFAVEAFPQFLQTIAKFMPMTYLNDAMRAVAFEGASFETLAPSILALAISGIVIYAVTIKIFKWD